MDDSQLTVLVGVGFKELPLADQLPMVRWVGSTGVQLFFNPEGQADPAAARREAEAAGLTVRSIHLPFGAGYDISSPAEAERRTAVARLIGALDAAATVGAAFGVLHPSWIIDAAITARERRQRGRHVAESLRAIAPEAEARGVRLALENMPPPLIGDRIEDLIAIVEAAENDSVGICFDTGHAHQRGRVPRMWRKAGPRIVTMHLHDNDGTDDQHRAPFGGTIDWDALRRELDRASYAGEVTIECVEALALLHRRGDTAWRDRFRTWWAGQ